MEERGPRRGAPRDPSLDQGAKKTLTKEPKALAKKDFTKGSNALAKKPRRPSPRDPRPWPRSQEGLHQGIQGLGQGAKKTFTKGSKALAKEQRRHSQRDTKPWQRHKEHLHLGIKALAKEPRRISPRVPRSQEDFLQGFQGAKKTFTVRLG